MESPLPPYFVYNSKQHFLDLFDRSETVKRVSRRAIFNEWDRFCTVYDSSGGTWKFRFDNAGRRSPYDRLLAAIHNPIEEVAIIWSRIGIYALAELREVYLDALAHDDDNLMQFAEADELSSQIQLCKSFQDVLSTWRWMRGDREGNLQ